MPLAIIGILIHCVQHHPLGVVLSCVNWEFGGRADGQVVRQICVVVLALRRSVSFCGSANWNLAHRQNVSFRTSPQTGVGISIEFQMIYRHTGVLTCLFLEFIHEKLYFQEIATPV